MQLFAFFALFVGGRAAILGDADDAEPMDFHEVPQGNYGIAKVVGLPPAPVPASARQEALSLLQNEVELKEKGSTGVKLGAGNRARQEAKELLTDSEVVAARAAASAAAADAFSKKATAPARQEAPQAAHAEATSEPLTQQPPASLLETKAKQAAKQMPEHVEELQTKPAIKTKEEIEEAIRSKRQELEKLQADLEAHQARTMPPTFFQQRAAAKRKAGGVDGAAADGSWGLIREEIAVCSSSWLCMSMFFIVVGITFGLSMGIACCYIWVLMKKPAWAKQALAGEEFDHKAFVRDAMTKNTLGGCGGPGDFGTRQSEGDALMF